MDPLGSFKSEIEAMFEKSFRDLSQKNSMNRTVLSNLIEAATDQSGKIEELSKKIERVKRNTNPEAREIKEEIEKQERLVHGQFDKMMHRLVQIEEGINSSRKTVEQNVRVNKQAEQSLGEVIRQLERIETQERVPEYKGNRDDLSREIQQFERMLDEDQLGNQVTSNDLHNYKKTVIEPLNHFEAKMTLHNKANEDILKDRLRAFTDKIRKVERRVQEAKNLMTCEIAKSHEEQRRIAQQMAGMQQQMVNIRGNLESADRMRKDAIQKDAVSLDAMIQEMLVQARRLEDRVESLRQGYSEEVQKMRGQAQQTFK